MALAVWVAWGSLCGSARGQDVATEQGSFKFAREALLGGNGHCPVPPLDPPPPPPWGPCRPHPPTTPKGTGRYTCPFLHNTPAGKWAVERGQTQVKPFSRVPTATNKGTPSHKQHGPFRHPHPHNTLLHSSTSLGADARAAAARGDSTEKSPSMAPAGDTARAGRTSPSLPERKQDKGAHTFTGVNHGTPPPTPQDTQHSFASAAWPNRNDLEYCTHTPKRAGAGSSNRAASPTIPT